MKNKVIAFEKDGVIYEKCKHCDDKYVSTTKNHVSESGEMIRTAIYGSVKKLKKEYNPIYA